MARISFFIPLLFIVLATLLSSGAPLISTIQQPTFSPEEATIKDLQNAFQGNQLTSRQLLEFYQRKINQLNSTLRAVIELNPDALSLADRADQERRSNAPISKNPLHGIPVLLKDNIATKDNMNTTAGSYALLKSLVPRNAFVAAKLIQAGAIILGKASLSEWSGLRLGAPQGWCARSGEGVASGLALYLCTVTI